MPILDMPLEELKKYQGRNPRPADFDSFWDETLKNLDTIDPKLEIKPNGFKSKVAEAFDMTFTSTKNARIHARLMKPKGLVGKAPAVLFFHGLSGSAPQWTYLLAYVSEGYVVAALDSRGQGGYSEDTGACYGTSFSDPFSRGVDGAPEDMHGVDLFADTAMLAKIVMGMDCVDETRVAARGGSQGGALTVACCALVPEMKLCVPDFPYMSDYKRVWEMDLDVDCYKGIRYYLRHFDPRHERVDEFFEKLGYVDIQNFAKRIRARVFMGTGLLDNICPPSTQFAMFNKITSEKDVVIYPDFGHENLEGHEELVFEFIKENL